MFHLQYYLVATVIQTQSLHSHLCMYVCMCVCIYTHTYIHTYRDDWVEPVFEWPLCVCVCARAHTHTHTHTHIHILHSIETLVEQKKFKKWDSNECRLQRKSSRVPFCACMHAIGSPSLLHTNKGTVPPLFFFEVRHPRCVGSTTIFFYVLHIQSNTTI